MKTKQDYDGWQWKYAEGHFDTTHPIAETKPTYDLDSPGKWVKVKLIEVKTIKPSPTRRERK